MGFVPEDVISSLNAYDHIDDLLDCDKALLADPYNEAGQDYLDESYDYYDVDYDCAEDEEDNCDFDEEEYEAFLNYDPLTRLPPMVDGYASSHYTLDNIALPPAHTISAEEDLLIRIIIFQLVGKERYHAAQRTYAVDASASAVLHLSGLHKAPVIVTITFDTEEDGSLTPHFHIDAGLLFFTKDLDLKTVRGFMECFL